MLRVSESKRQKYCRIYITNWWSLQLVRNMFYHINRAFPLRCNGMQYTWRHIWGALEGLLDQILHCYMQEHSLHSNSCCFVYRGKTKLSEHRSRVPALAFSTVVAPTLCDFVPRGLSSIAINCPRGIWDSHESYGMIPSVALCPSCPSHPSVRKRCTDSEGASRGVPYYRHLSQLSIPSLSP